MLQTKIHIVLSSIGVILGLSGFICFCIYFNYEAAIWALFSVLHSSLALMLHCHYLKESLHVNYSRKALQYLGDLGIIGFVSGAALTLFYIFLECYYKLGMTPVETSIVIKMVWSFMMTKYAFLLYYTTKSISGPIMTINCSLKTLILRRHKLEWVSYTNTTHWECMPQSMNREICLCMFN